MIYCYLCPLKDVCPVVKVKTESKCLLPVTLNWLPDGNENECPLYKAIKELGKGIERRGEVTEEKGKLEEDCSLCQGSKEVVNRPPRLMGATYPKNDHWKGDEHLEPCPLCCGHSTRKARRYKW